MTTQQRNTAAILRDRASALAARPADENIVTAAYVTFALGGHCLGVPIEAVSRAIEIRHLTAIPTAPNYLLGVVAVDGQVVSLLDLAQFIQLPRQRREDALCAIILAIASPRGTRRLGLAADRLLGIEDIPVQSIVTLAGRHQLINHVANVKDTEYLLLQVDALLSDPRLADDRAAGD